MMCLSCSLTSCAVCQRSSGSFAKQIFTRRSSAGGAMGWIDEIGGGSRSRTAAMALAGVLPSKARLPVAISYSTAPNAKMSERASAGLPSTCSGAMY